MLNDGVAARARSGLAAGRGILGRACLLLGAFAVGGLAAVALDPTLVSANDDAGVRDFFVRQAPERRAERPAAPTGAVLAYAPIRSFDPFGEAMRGGWDGEPARERRSATPRASGGDRSAPVGQRTVCVRMCDGFQFPLSGAGVGGSAGEQAEACQSACPSATVKVFTLPNGSDSISDAVAADGQRYSTLPMALAYTRTRDQACTCRPSGAGLAPASPLVDRTLRPGDLLVVDGKPRAFQGSPSARIHKLTDFGDATGARLLTSATRSLVDERLGLSRRAKAQRELDALRKTGAARKAQVTAPFVAGTPAPASASAASTRGPNGVRVIGGVGVVAAR